MRTAIIAARQNHLASLTLAHTMEIAQPLWPVERVPTAQPHSGPRCEWQTSRRSGGVDVTALHLVSPFAAGAGSILVFSNR
jgi:hypothetical protein